MQQLSSGQQELVTRRKEQRLCILMDCPGYDVSVFDFFWIVVQQLIHSDSQHLLILLSVLSTHNTRPALLRGIVFISF